MPLSNIITNKNSNFWILLTLLYFTFTFDILAQSKEPTANFIKLKFEREVSDFLKEENSFQVDANGFIESKIESVDILFSKYKVESIERVFVLNPKFIRRQEAAGLHLWYRLKISGDEVTIASCLNEFSANEFVQIAEREIEKIQIENRSIPETLSNNNNSLNSSLEPPNDPYFHYTDGEYYDYSQWHFKNLYIPNADVDLLSAWQIETGSPDVIVAVMDLGIEIDHFDLKDNIWTNELERDGIEGVDDDGNGYVDDIHGFDFVDHTGNIVGADHGTHVAGTIAARSNNGIGVAGMAGGQGEEEGVKIMPCTIIGGGVFGELGSVEEAFMYAADNGAVIAQNSWGYLNIDDFEQSVKDAIDYFITYAGQDENGIQTGPMKGGIVIFSTGNENSENLKYPAAYDKVMAVASSDYKDKKSEFSNYGDWIDITAPGSTVLSTFSTKSSSPYRLEEGIGIASGTSMACPHVSGAAALIVSKYGGLDFTPEQVWDRLIYSANSLESMNPEYVGKLGAGRLNVYQSLLENDGIAPDAVIDLDVDYKTFESLQLKWTATGSSGLDGKAYAYELRYATEPITDENFSTAIQITDVPRPAWFGQVDSLIVNNLNYNTQYYFALKAIDVYGNLSELSNVLEVRTELPPVISVLPENIEVELYRDESINQSFVVSNSTGKAPLEVEVNLPLTTNNTKKDKNLTNVLFELNDNYKQITDAIPEAFEFDRIMTNSISSAELYDFLDGGNFLNTNLGSAINYSDNKIVSSEALNNSSYFTRHLPGLFVFAADLEQVEYFEISGELNRDYQYDELPGKVNGVELEMTHGNKKYKGFVKRVYDNYNEYNKSVKEPSLNHLVIVEHHAGMNQEYSLDSENDFHRVNGLAESSRLYYLVFASNKKDEEKGWGWVSDDEMEDIMNLFIASIENSWLSIDESVVTINEEENKTLDLHISATDQSVGMNTKEVLIQSNDPDKPTVSLNIKMNVLNYSPEFIEGLNDLEMVLGQEPSVIDLSTISFDSESDLLSYEVISSDPNVIVAKVMSSKLSIEAQDVGQAEVELKIKDPFDYGNSITFHVSVSAPVTAINDEELLNKRWKIYPNPIESDLTVEVEIKASCDFIKWSIMDHQGRVLQEMSSSSGELSAGLNTLTINTKHLSDGIYYFQIQTKQNQDVRKVVKMSR